MFNRTSVGTGISLGSLLAVVISWSWNHSIIWALIHFCLGWLYVIYAVLFHHRLF